MESPMVATLTPHGVRVHFRAAKLAGIPFISLCDTCCNSRGVALFASAYRHWRMQRGFPDPGRPSPPRWSRPLKGPARKRRLVDLVSQGPRNDLLRVEGDWLGPRMMPETDRKTSVWKDALWICLAGAIGSTLWIAYQSDVWDEATRVQMKIKAQHDEFVVRRHLWDKSQEIKAAAITAAQSRTDVQSQLSIREIQGLQNHVVRERKQRKLRLVDARSTRARSGEDLRCP
jgi:hypothetical protein